ncbi:hypothetical protein ABH945_001663 [Paraburkholderia sp. GAS333]|uniref:DUF4148 domain-containing protein n=1 Tax=Paraburkholderia sp. GAS333 TaxID=3156279 RepID=UPI003D255ACE
MKAVWVRLCVSVAGLVALGAGLGVTQAQAAGLTRAQVLAELADYQSVGYQFSDVDYPQNAIEATRKVVALRAERAAAAAASTAKVAARDAGWPKRD